MSRKQLELITQYFEGLSEVQINQLEALGPLYIEWNEKINVISRKDIENLYLHHILHSLSIAKFISFKAGTKIIDLGTGGGFPGIPLAILFPDCHFLLIDSINKKLMVVNEICQTIGLHNVKTQHTRIEDTKEKCEFVVTRAVAKSDKLLSWTKKIILDSQKNVYPNGIIALKGDIKDEINLIPKGEYKEIVPLSRYFTESYFEEKFLLYIQG